MTAPIRLLAALAAALSLLACAPRPAQEAAAPSPAGLAAPANCGAYEWNEAGVKDALAGRESETGLLRLDSCPGLTLAGRERAEDAYLAGHDEGRAAYCAPVNARALGQRRETPTLACPPPLDEAFETAYAAGLAEPEEDEVWRPRLIPYLSLGVGSGWRTGLAWGLGVAF